MDYRLHQQLLLVELAQHRIPAGQWAIVPEDNPSDIWAAGDDRYDSEAEARAEIPQVAEIFGISVDFWTVIEGKG